MYKASLGSEFGYGLNQFILLEEQNLNFAALLRVMLQFGDQWFL